ncbi:peroxisome assembly factor 2 isoform X1 [Trichogramma pretiosum]|uniref:peroxisome assembly factor 2 isoform X1 n=2 Tax=Trichogramma pretiosum TaxID=7493 RepID=UPI0006C952E9|nr:peroxisome assembly factor 2 isoform X1 [Trichogramma pretiosum]
MFSIQQSIGLLVYLSRLTNKFTKKPTRELLFIYFLLKRFQRLLKMELQLYCLPKKLYVTYITKFKECNEKFIDDGLYILCNNKDVDKSKNWFYLCSKKSRKKYKVAVLFVDYLPLNTIYVSEVLKNNLNKHFKAIPEEDSTYFLFSVNDEAISYATEVKISLINSPSECTEELLNQLLKSYFLVPKYLRPNDILQITVKDYVPEATYCVSNSKLNLLFFKVNDIRIGKDKAKDGSFVVYGKTSLIEEKNIHSYLPCKCICDILNEEKISFCSWPPILIGQLLQIQSCVMPFLQNETKIDVKPVFLVEGPTGCGKSRLVKLAAETLGLNIFEANLIDIQALTAAQTEAKLRIILYEAEQCLPCILLLHNIEVLGINAEGHKDQRVIASFSEALKKLYRKKLNFPLIIFAISSESEMAIDTESTFVDKITIESLTQNERIEILSWVAQMNGLKCEADLQKISKMCSDFVLADLEALVSHATKSRLKLVDSTQKQDADLTLTTEDFVSACEYMQSTFADQIGAPKVPKVHWDDIGGLAELKREIMRRIEMPLLNISGMNRSGLLLYGPPGTGKTLLAKAVATECQLHFLSVKGPELLNMYVGQSEKNVRQVFERARAASPSIIFFDELDSLAPNRGRSGDSGGVMDRVVSQLLAEMDGLESEGRVFVIGATNRPDLVDPALLRPGRFDKMLYVGVYSDAASQISVLEALTKHFNLKRGGEELKELVENLPRNLTGADLYSVCSNAWLRAVRKLMVKVDIKRRDTVSSDDVIVELDDFLEVVGELVPSVSEEELKRYEKLRDELSSRG